MRSFCGTTTTVTVPLCLAHAQRFFGSSHGAGSFPGSSGGSAHGGGGGGGGNNACMMSFGIDPSKLDIQLNLDTIDMAAVVEATQAALAKERGRFRTPLKDDAHEETSSLRAGQAEIQEDSSPGDGLEGSGKERAESGSSSSAAAAASGRGGRTVRGVRNAGRVHDTNSPSTAYAQRQAEGAPRYTLVDTLRDCAISGNWSKAYGLFDGALQTSCRHALRAPGSSTSKSDADDRGSGEAVGAAGEHDAAAALAEREQECFEQLRKLSATLPSLRGNDRQAVMAARAAGAKNMVGLLRWNGRHYYLLMKCLMESGRVQEAARVWDVMLRIGFVEYHIEERTVNSLIALLRHCADGTPGEPRRATSLSPQRRVIDAHVDAEKAFLRKMVMELEDVAHTQGMRLGEMNSRTAQTARIAEALEQNASTTSEPRASDAGLRVGDFNGLLRRARSEDATARVLAMMKKLGVSTDGTTYASIIASLHQPYYRLDGVTDVAVGEDETASNATSTTSSPPTAEEEEEGVDDATSSSTAGATGGTDLSSHAERQAQYEAYRERRIERAKQWFQTCPDAQRTAEVFNEMLYLLRAKQHKTDFDTLLTEFRGSPVRTEADRVAVEEANTAATVARATQRGARESEAASPPSPSSGGVDSGQSADTVSASTITQSTEEALRAVPPIVAPSWRVRPNGKTYELLMYRARYVHDWQAMWELYEEMQLQNIRGTPRLFHLLLTEANVHPPARIVKKASGDVSAFIMSLYDEMRRQRIDVTSLSSTVSLVNAWSATRGKRRWV